MKPHIFASNLTQRDAALLTAWHALIESGARDPAVLAQFTTQGRVFGEHLNATIARSAEDLTAALFAKEDKP